MISVISHRIEWIVILEEIEKIFSSHTVFANKLEFIVNNNEKKKQPPNLLNVISFCCNCNSLQTHRA